MLFPNQPGLHTPGFESVGRYFLDFFQPNQRAKSAILAGLPKIVGSHNQVVILAMDFFDRRGGQVFKKKHVFDHRLGLNGTG